MLGGYGLIAPGPYAIGGLQWLGIGFILLLLLWRAYMVMRWVVVF